MIHPADPASRESRRSSVRGQAPIEPRNRPHAPFDADSSAKAERIRQDAAGQYRAGTVDPNRDGLMSANPVVLSENGDATSGNGHGRDRNGSRKEQD